MDLLDVIETYCKIGKIELAMQRLKTYANTNPINERAQELCKKVALELTCNGPLGMALNFCELYQIDEDYTQILETIHQLNNEPLGDEATNPKGLESYISSYKITEKAQELCKDVALELTYKNRITLALDLCKLYGINKGYLEILETIYQHAHEKVDNNLNLAIIEDYRAIKAQGGI
ncbi:MAG: hypothetical protein PHF86_05500 [Candidatus Nanoarchaeia archaeon]|nr:hypothetical protein [Candidatus Nanoarchaeia archaeon]